MRAPDHGRSSCSTRSTCPADLFPPLIEPGETVGTLRPTVAAQTGLASTLPVIAVGSHDTASAVVGVPASDRQFAYVSSRHLVPGRASSSTSRSSARRAGPRTSPTRAASTAGSATSATRAGCGCCRNRCAPGARPVTDADQEALLAEAADARAGRSDGRRRRRRVPPAGGHAQPDPVRLRGERAAAAGVRGRRGSLHPRFARRGVRADRARGRGTLRSECAR